MCQGDTDICKPLLNGLPTLTLIEHNEQGTERSKLALMTSHPDPELVFFSYKETESGGSELTVQDTLSLYERSPREAEFYNDLIIHPSGTVAIASCYVGKLKVIKLKAGGYVDNFDFS